jgi:DNA-binding NarL/FixJ family response regulator
VQSHVKRIYEKLEVTSKAEATAVAIRRGLVDP